MVTALVHVTFTDRSRDDTGAFVTRDRFVSVLADGADCPTLVAAQIVGATIGADDMVLSSRLLSAEM